MEKLRFFLAIAFVFRVWNSSGHEGWFHEEHQALAQAWP